DMRGSRSFLAAMLGTICVVPAYGEAEQRDRPVLTLGQAVSEALQRNDRMINEHDTVEQANLGVRLAENNFRPKIVPNILGSFGQSDARNQNYRLDVL